MFGKVRSAVDALKATARALDPTGIDGHDVAALFDAVSEGERVCGAMKALLARRKIDSVRVFALGVKRDWQHIGVAAKFYVEHFNSAGSTPQT